MGIFIEQRKELRSIQRNLKFEEERKILFNYLLFPLILKIFQKNFFL